MCVCGGGVVIATLLSENNGQISPAPLNPLPMLPKLRSLILKLGFLRLLLSKSNYGNSNKDVHGDKAQLPQISHQGLAYLSLLPDAAVTCTKQRI